jgi:hypothetical protein
MNMANEMPSPTDYQGLSRKVLEYCESFRQLVDKIRHQRFTEADWAPIEELVDVKSFRREGVFLSNVVEVTDWQHYRKVITQYGGMTTWEGTLRRITEVPGLVFLELQERNTRDGETDVSNTVTIYSFNQAAKLSKLDVYVGHIAKRAAS